MIVDKHLLTDQRGPIKALLRQHGIYPTGQRLAIASVLMARHQHVTADELHERVCTADEVVSKATVYNTLNLFVDKGLVRQIIVDAGKTFYDSNRAHHQHVYNVDTGELIDTSLPLSDHIKHLQPPAGTDLERIDVVIRVRNSFT